MNRKKDSKPEKIKHMTEFKDSNDSKKEKVNIHRKRIHTPPKNPQI